MLFVIVTYKLENYICLNTLNIQYSNFYYTLIITHYILMYMYHVNFNTSIHSYTCPHTTYMLDKHEIGICDFRWTKSKLLEKNWM